MSSRPNNPKVSSKGMRNAGKSGFKPSDPRQPTRNQVYRDPVPASSPARKAYDQPATPHREQVGHVIGKDGWATDKFNHGTTPNADAGRHGDSMGSHAATTAAAQGMGYFATGGAHGKPSPHKAK